MLKPWIFAAAMLPAALFSKELLEDASFEENSGKWPLPKGYRIERNAGRNGTAGLVYTRTNPKEYPLLMRRVKLEPGRTYEISAWIRVKNIKGAGASICVEFSTTERKHNGGVYLKNIRDNSGEWHEVSGTFTVPEKTAYSSVTAYMRFGSTGTAFFDDFSLREKGDRYIIYSPGSHNRIEADGTLKLKIIRNNNAIPAKEKMICRLRIGGTTLQKTITGDTLAFSIPDSVPEQAKCRITLLEPRTKKTKFETEIPVTRKPETPLAGECGISPDGITLVDGKPFMPLGFFCNLSDRAVSLARSVGANIFLSYAWMGGLEGMRKWMDVLQKNEMKLLFSIKHLYSEKDVWNGIRGSDAIVRTAVETLRKHPALLGWYICDELPPAMQEKIIARHRMVNALDPYHPTYAVYYQASELFGYSPGLDVLGVDVYPIRNLPPEKTDMARVEAIMEAARKTGKTIWAVPQIFDYRIYVDEGRPPTEQEMRSMSLLMAGLGAKGFIYYMLNDLWRSNKLPKDNFEREWPKVRSVITGMKKLEPFILSKHPITELPVQCGKGKVRAFRLTAEDGRKAVLVCSILTGAAEASWKLPGSWRSLHGKTTFADGLAKFKGSSIDSDVLMEQ